MQKLQKQLNELKHGRQKFSLEVTALTEKEAALKQQIKVSAGCEPAIYFTCPACCLHVYSCYRVMRICKNLSCNALGKHGVSCYVATSCYDARRASAVC